MSRGRPGRPEGRHDRRAEAGRRQGRRRRRPPELRRHDPRLDDLQQGRHPGDLRLGHQPEAHRAGLQDQFRIVGRDDQQGPAIAELHRHELKAEEGRDHRRRDRLRRGHRQRSREDAEGRQGRRCSPASAHRQGNRLQGDPHQAQGRRTPTSCSTAAWTPPAARCSSRARELGIKAVFAFGDGACTDEMGKLAGDRGRGPGVLAGRPAARGREQEVPRRVQGEVQRRPISYAPYTYDARQPADRGDEEGQLDRPGEVPAGARERSASTAPPARSRSTPRATARTPR